MSYTRTIDCNKKIPNDWEYVKEDTGSITTFSSGASASTLEITKDGKPNRFVAFYSDILFKRSRRTLGHHLALDFAKQIMYADIGLKATATDGILEVRDMQSA